MALSSHEAAASWQRPSGEVSGIVRRRLKESRCDAWMFMGAVLDVLRDLGRQCVYFVCMPREASQEKGRVGARTAQRWLEATTFVELPWNSYHHEALCEIECLDDSTKMFDLAGYFLTDERTPISVEVKNVDTDAHLRDKFHEFLAVAYSSTAKRKLKSRPDDKREFMWVSWHPFGPMNRWTKLASVEEIEISLGEYSGLLNGHEVDRELLQVVSERIWVLTFNPKQEMLSLDADDLSKVMAALPRKRTTL
ncbi:hypothetical protein IRT45_19440 [Nocardia sp. BSTN01]|uniref:hypothetical protein n=1 Tax=Nocardia sp. BSTN01 TaxID=2783665 RepID=UPI00188FCC7F|nr:hypothetical protein [Nocardia sp. BSTN01]MBF4999325.1 hypothetical protein [Nocardia sp. BSTN01]